MPKFQSSSGPISYTELKKRAAQGTLSERQRSDYFFRDEAGSTAFVPAVRLNEELVDTEGRKPRPRDVTKLLLKAEDAAKAKTESPPDIKSFDPMAAVAQVTVLAEGDSWFRLPDSVFLGYPKDVVDILKLTHTVKPVAFWGDEIAQMVSAQNKKNYLVPLNSGLYRHFIFSGGGNDVLAGVKQYVKPIGTAGTSPSNPGSYIKPGFAIKITETIGHYKTLHADVRGSNQPATPIYVHGYDYAIPKPGGPYVGKRLEDLGFDPTSALARKIVGAMLDRFNAALEAFADARATVTYVDMRSTLNATDWHKDEIHPSTSGAKKIARKFVEAIAAGIPVG